MAEDIDKLARELQEKILEDAGEVFSEKALRTMMEPKNAGEMKDADAVAQTKGICGDRMRIYLRIEGNRIAKATFLTDGCGTSIACGSMATQIAAGKTVREAMEISPGEILDALDGLPDSHVHCSILAAITLQKAIAKHLLKREGMRESQGF
jgi:nitrogen fixation protein NifU and related proteins